MTCDFKIKLIAAVSKDGAIGLDNKLLWYIPEDLAIYKQYTLGKALVVGSKTYDSLPEKAKMNRVYFIVGGGSEIETHLTGEAPHYIRGFRNPYIAIDHIRTQTSFNEAIVVGGEMVYNAIIKDNFGMYAPDESVITWVDETFQEANKFFPMEEFNELMYAIEIGEERISKTGIKFQTNTYGNKRLKNKTNEYSSEIF